MKRLETPLNEPTNQISVKFLKVVKTTNKKRCDKTLGTSVLKMEEG